MPNAGKRWLARRTTAGVALAVTWTSLAVAGLAPAVTPTAAAAAPSGHIITTVAGGLSSGPARSFRHTLTNVAVSGTTLYASDYTFDVIRAIDLVTGNERVFAGTGSKWSFYGDGGPATSAGLSRPMGLVVDSQGNLYFADSLNRRIRKVTPAGVISTIAGGGPSGFLGEGGPATDADITPVALALDVQGNLFFADGVRLVRKVDTAGRIFTVAGGGVSVMRDGLPALSAWLNLPMTVALDPAGNLYMGDNSGYVWRVAPDGIATALLRIRTPWGTTTGPYVGATALRAGPDGTLFVLTETQVLAVDRSSHTTVVAGTGAFGDAGDGGPATSAELRGLSDIDFDDAGNLYVTGTRIRRVDTGGTITAITLDQPPTALWDGKQAVDVEFDDPSSVAVGPGGMIYVGEETQYRLRKVDSSGVITTVAGGGGGATTLPADGVPARSAMVAPTAVTVSPAGHVYFGDRTQVFRIDEIGILRLVAGVAGTSCSMYANCGPGDGGPATAAHLVSVSALAVGKDGEVYIADGYLNRVRRVDRSGIITTFAGGSSRPGLADPALFAGDGGPAIAARLNAPTSMQLDALGNLFIADAGHRRVRKVDTSGVITTVAGAGEGPAHTGDGGPATAAFLYPQGIAVDPSGRIFITDAERVRVVGTDGTISAVAGNETRGFWGDGGAALSAGLSGVHGGRDHSGLAIDERGNLLIADVFNHRIRQVAGVADLRVPPTPTTTTGRPPTTPTTATAPASTTTTVPAPPPSQTTRFVDRAYRDLLFRPPTAAESAVWVGVLATGYSRTNLAATLVWSEEFRRSAASRYYQGYLGRAALPTEQAVFAQMLVDGWRYDQLAAVLLSTEEFYAAKGGNPGGFVDALWRLVAGSAPDPAGRAFWVARLNAGASRYSAALAFLQSVPAQQAPVRYAVAVMLDRPVDGATLGYWTNQLQSGLRQENVYMSLVGSGEYWAKS